MPKANAKQPPQTPRNPAKPKGKPPVREKAPRKRAKPTAKPPKKTTREPSRKTNETPPTVCPTCGSSSIEYRHERILAWNGVERGIQYNQIRWLTGVCKECKKPRVDKLFEMVEESTSTNCQ